MRQAACPIGGEKLRLGSLVANELLPEARMRRACEGVAFWQFVGFAPLHCAVCPGALAGSSRASTTDQMAAATSFWRFQRVDDRAALGLGRGNVEERPAQRLMIGERLGLEAVGAPLPSSLRSALEARFGRNVENQGEVRRVRPDDDLFEPRDIAGRQIARRALIGARRIGEAVADDPCPARQRRKNGLVEMVGARRGEQQRLALGTKLGRETGKDRLA